MSTTPDAAGPAGRPAVRVLVVDDDPLVRTGVSMLLAGESDIEVVGEATDGDEVGAAVQAHSPDVVLMDVRMRRTDGVSATRELMVAGARAPAVIMLTTFDADATVLAAMQAGASGYLLKHAEPTALIEAIRRAGAGDPVFSPEALRTLMRTAAEITGPGSGEDDTAFASLSERARLIADAVARGLSNAEIAGELYLSAGTVKAEISAMLTMLGLDNRTQLAIRAHSRGRGV